MIRGDVCLTVVTVLVRKSGQMIFFLLFSLRKKCLLEVFNPNLTLLCEYVFGM